ncbi:MAG: serine O-acetyltransferase [Solirubrobacterales bacterium]|jgi:serine O-acetyltransferase|nr:serine O-acetyltransferase [Solirubrobacterales bacterium]
MQVVDRESVMRDVRARHPRFGAAVIADARVTAQHRGERAEFRSKLDAIGQALRLMWQSDAFLAQALYRAKARMQALGVPIAPRIAHRLAIAIGQVTIGDPVVIAPGLYILHGQVVIDGITVIGSGVTIAPFVTIGLHQGDFVGPVVGDGVSIGTGAKVIGRLRVGDGARIGANAVVIGDVAPGATALGVHGG